MTEPAQPTNGQSKPAAPQRPWYVDLVLGSVALAIVYLAATLALDTGSLLAYGIVILFVVLAVRHFVRCGVSLKKGRQHGSGR